MSKQTPKPSRSLKRSASAFNLAPYKSQPAPVPMTPGVANNRVVKAVRRPVIPNHPKLSESGMAFLKCAFAPPDFANSNVRGVPDLFEGRTLVKKHRIVAPFVCPANTDVYILLAPIPGIAYSIATVAAGAGVTATTVFTAVPYSDFSQMFGATSGANAADIVTKYRFVSNHFELVPTVNQMSWTGNIQSWKLAASVAPRSAVGTTNANNLYSVVGLQSCNATNADQYTGPFNLGVYTASYSTGAVFSFNQVLESQTAIPNALQSGDFAQITATGTGCIPGMDTNFDTSLIKISGVGANTTNTAIIKAWACVEYQVLPGNSLYEFSTISPCDEFALMLYKQIVNELPVGVSFIDNDTFWKRVLDIIRRVSGSLSIMPNQYGAIAGGVNAITTAIDHLVYQ